MNKAKHLFDACVSHRNTLQVQRKAEEFFNNEEGKFYKEWDKTHTTLCDMWAKEDEDYYNEIFTSLVG